MSFVQTEPPDTGSPPPRPLRADAARNRERILVAAREVFVSTMGTIYGVGDTSSGDQALREQLVSERNAETGKPAYTPLIAVGLMVFYVYALMCMSTVAVTVREAGGGRRGLGWAALQFGYMLVLAYAAAFVVYQGGRLLGLG